MFKFIVSFTSLACILAFASLFAGCGDSTCCQSVDIEVGWRRDRLDWKTNHLHSSYISGHVKDRLHFDDINSYTVNGQAKWVSSDYYIRLKADYGTTEKGRAHEHFHIASPYLYYPIGVETSDKIKRRSEVYDFDAAVGYPLAFFLPPSIGCSFDRLFLPSATFTC